MTTGGTESDTATEIETFDFWRLDREQKHVFSNFINGVRKVPATWSVK